MMQPEARSRFHIDLVHLAAVNGEALYRIQLLVACAAPARSMLILQHNSLQERRSRQHKRHKPHL